MIESAGLLLGIDVGGTKCAVVLGRADGMVVAREEWPSHAGRGAGAMVGDIVGAARRLMGSGEKPLAAGVSIGGPLDCDAGVIHSPPGLPGWDEVPLKAILESELGLSVRVLHDAAACALAEYRWGGYERSPRRLAYLTCGTGFGVGLVFDGVAYSGAGGRFPEIGHVRLSEEGPMAFGKAGSYEAFCSGGGLGGLAAWMEPGRWGGDGARPGGAELAGLARAGDGQAAAVLEMSARSVGRACAMLGDLLVLDRIVIGSLARYLGEPWLAVVRETFGREVLPFVASNCTIAASALGERLQDLSALAAALHLPTDTGRP